jgi:hypothetical protein
MGNEVMNNSQRVDKEMFSTSQREVIRLLDSVSKETISVRECAKNARNGRPVQEGSSDSVENVFISYYRKIVAKVLGL